MNKGSHYNNAVQRVIQLAEMFTLRHNNIFIFEILIYNNNTRYET